MVLPWGDLEDDYEDTPPPEPPPLEVDITDPAPLAVLYDHRGDEAWTLYDRRRVAFGFQPRET